MNQKRKGFRFISVFLLLFLLCSCTKQYSEIKTSVIGIEFDEYFDDSFAALSERLTQNNYVWNLDENYGSYILSETTEGQKAEVELYFLYEEYNSFLQDYAKEKPVKDHHLATVRKVWTWEPDAFTTEDFQFVKKVYEYLVQKYGDPFYKIGLDVEDIHKCNGSAEWRTASSDNPDISISFQKDSSGVTLILYQVNPFAVDILVSVKN